MDCVPDPQLSSVRFISQKTLVDLFIFRNVCPAFFPCLDGELFVTFYVTEASRKEGQISFSLNKLHFSSSSSMVTVITFTTNQYEFVFIFWK